jgi:hypothetical protein
VKKMNDKASKPGWFFELTSEETIPRGARAAGSEDRGGEVGGVEIANWRIP